MGRFLAALEAPEGVEWGDPTGPLDGPILSRLNGATEDDRPEHWGGANGAGGGRVHYWRSDPVARKPHDCSACRDIIGKGDPYKREAIPMHTYIYVWKQCCKCA